jgi:hypothetical protein
MDSSLAGSRGRYAKSAGERRSRQTEPGSDRGWEQSGRSRESGSSRRTGRGSSVETEPEPGAAALLLEAHKGAPARLGWGCGWRRRAFERRAGEARCVGEPERRHGTSGTRRLSRQMDRREGSSSSSLDWSHPLLIRKRADLEGFTLVGDSKSIRSQTSLVPTRHDPRSSLEPNPLPRALREQLGSPLDPLFPAESLTRSGSTLQLHQLLPPLLSPLLTYPLGSSSQPQINGHAFTDPSSSSSSPSDLTPSLIRQQASDTLAALAQEFGSVYESLIPRLSKTLLRSLSPPSPPGRVEGALLGLGALGRDAVKRGIWGDHGEGLKGWADGWERIWSKEEVEAVVRAGVVSLTLPSFNVSDTPNESAEADNQLFSRPVNS